jgi:MAM domain, meprin/A5/mu/Secretion system C-terminal sorting domain/SprB repeat
VGTYSVTVSDSKSCTVAGSIAVPAACYMSASATVFPVSCSGAQNGQAQVVPTGTYAVPVGYLWSNGATTSSIGGLAPGAYSVTLTDANQCSAAASGTVTSPAPLSISVTKTNVSAPGGNDGTASSAPAGGTPPYTYLWSNGATTQNIAGLVVGQYSVTVTDSKTCTASGSVLVPSNVSCTANYTGPFPYTNPLENTGAGIFQQVSGIDDFNWNRQTGATPTAQTGPDAAHQGVYYWFARASGNNAPNKKAMLKNSHCINLTTLNNPVFEFYYHLYGNQMGSLTIEVSTNNEATWTQVWTRSGDQGNQWFKASIDLTPYKTAFTKIRITALTGTGSRSDIAIDALYIGELSGNQFSPFEPGNTETTPVASTKIYPNPSTGYLQIELPNGKAFESLTVVNQTGQTVLADTSDLIPGSTKILDLSGLPDGCYFFLLRGDEQVEKQKIVLMKR